MATSAIRNYDGDALDHVAAAEKLLSTLSLRYPELTILRAQVHATLAVALSNIGSQG